MDNKDKFDFNSNSTKINPTKSRSWGLFSAMFWAFFIALALSNVLNPYFSEILSGLLSGIAPLLIGIVIAFIFYRLVDFIERVILKNAFTNSPYKFAIKRTISIFIVVIVILGIFALIIAILLPKIIEVIQRLTSGSGDGGTQIYNNVVNEICNIIQRWFGAEVSQEAIKDVLNKIFEWFMATVGQIGDVFALSMNVLSGFINVLLSLLIAIFILKDKEKISRFCRRYSYSHFRKEKADEICVITSNANKILYNYVICKLIEFAIIFVSLGLVYMILNLEFTWELALIIGIFNFIPYFGIYIGSLFAVLIILIFNSVNSALYMIIATIIITTLELNIIIPIITSSRLKVSSLIVISSIIIGGAMFGIVGMLIAPPIFALISVVIMGNIELKENHMKYVMELNKAREKNMQDEKEQLGIISQMPNTNLSNIDEGKEESTNKPIENKTKKSTIKESKFEKLEDNKENTKTKSQKTKSNASNKVKNNNINEEKKDLKDSKKHKIEDKIE